MSFCVYHSVDVMVWMPLCGYHPVNTMRWISFCGCYLVDVIVSQQKRSWKN